MSRPSAEPMATVDGAVIRRNREDEVYVRRRHQQAPMLLVSRFSPGQAKRVDDGVKRIAP